MTAKEIEAIVDDHFRRNVRAVSSESDHTFQALARRGMEFAWMKEGVTVNVHSVIDGPPTKTTTIKGDPFVSNSGDWVVFLHGVRGYFCCEAVTYRDEEGA